MPTMRSNSAPLRWPGVPSPVEPRQFARLVLGERHEVRQRLGGKFVRYHKHGAGRAERHDRLEPFRGIEVARRIEADAGRERSGRIVAQKRIAIGRRIGDELIADGAAGAGPVLDHGGLTEHLRHGVEYDARHDVGHTAGTERNDHADAA